MNDYLLPSGAETSALATLEKKLLVVRDLVAAVAKGFKNGLFLYGAGGVGHAVRRHGGQGATTTKTNLSRPTATRVLGGRP